MFLFGGSSAESLISGPIPELLTLGKFGASVHFLLSARKNSCCVFNMRINRCRIISQSDSAVMGLCRNLRVMRSFWHFTHVLHGFRSAKWLTCYLVILWIHRAEDSKAPTATFQRVQKCLPLPSLLIISEFFLICEEP